MKSISRFAVDRIAIREDLGDGHAQLSAMISPPCYRRPRCRGSHPPIDESPVMRMNLVESFQTGGPTNIRAKMFRYFDWEWALRKQFRMAAPVLAPGESQTVRILRPLPRTT